MKHFFCLILLLSVFLSPIFMPSCKERDDLKRTNLLLDVTSVRQDEMTTSDFVILTEAMKRAGLFFDGYMIRMSAETASEINVSERLFSLIQQIVENSNKPDNRPCLATKSGDRPYSCVAYALSQWVGAPSFEVMDHYIDSVYKQDGGVPASKIGEVLFHFFPYNFAAYSMSNIPDNMLWAANRTVGICYTGGGNGHMVNIVGRCGDLFTVQDFSMDTVETTTIPASSFVSVYENLTIDSLAVN